MSNLRLFIIGFVAGICGTMAGPFSSELTALSKGDSITVLSVRLIIICLAVSLIVGMGTMMMIDETDTTLKKNDVFLKALGIPALLSSAFHAADATNTVINADNKAKAVIESVQDAAGIPNAPASAPGDTSFNETFRLAFDVKEEKVFVSIFHTDSYERALLEMNRITVMKAESADVIRFDGEWHVIVGGKLDRGDAVALAISFKRRGFSPVILPANRIET